MRKSNCTTEQCEKEVDGFQARVEGVCETWRSSRRQQQAAVAEKEGELEEEAGEEAEEGVA